MPFPPNLPLLSREWKNGSNSYNCTPFLHSLLTKGKQKKIGHQRACLGFGVGSLVAFECRNTDSEVRWEVSGLGFQGDSSVRCPSNSKYRCHCRHHHRHRHLHDCRTIRMQGLGKQALKARGSSIIAATLRLLVRGSPPG